MSGYLQRLYDRAAGGLAVTAPALRPGSPLALFDQRLGVSDLAQDFSFGVISRTGEFEHEEPAAPTESPQVSARPRTARPPASQQERKPSGTAAAGQSKETSKSSARRPKAEQVPDKQVRETSAPEGQPDEPIEQRLPKAKSEDHPVPSLPRHDAASTTPAQLLEAKPPQSARDGTSITYERPAEALAAEPSTAETSGRAKPSLAASEPAARPIQARAPAVIPEPASEPERLAKTVAPQNGALPIEREIPQFFLPQTPPIDWTEVDRRIESALRESGQNRAQQPERPRLRQPREDPQQEATAARAGFTSAAEASVIGAIEHSPRHRMLFGTRWR